jgi:hypothetical protein
MASRLKYLMVAAVLGFVMFGATPSAESAPHPYWTNHWGWYDNTYRPYYNNYYYSAPAYRPVAPYYGGYYGSPYYYNGYTGYNSFYGPAYVAPGVGVRVGRMNFGWW